MLRAGVVVGCCLAVLSGCAAAAAAPSSMRTTVWTTVADSGTGVHIDLPAPVRGEPAELLSASDDAVTGRAYLAAVFSDRVDASLHIDPRPRDARGSSQTTAERAAHFACGAVRETRPLDVTGHPALDVRVEVLGCGGTDGAGDLLLRIVDTPAFEVVVTVAGGADEDLDVARQVFERVCASLRIP